MAQESENHGVFGTTLNIDSGNTIDALAAEELRRAEELNSETAAGIEDVNPPEALAAPAPRRSPDVQFREDERNRAATARADAAEKVSEARVRAAEAQAQAVQAQAQARAQATQAQAQVVQMRAQAVRSRVQRVVQSTATRSGSPERLAAIQGFAATVQDPDDFNEGLLSHLVGEGVATPGEIERNTRQQIARSLSPADAEEEGPSSFEDFQKRRNMAESALRDEFASAGNGADIGGKEYQKRRQEVLEEGGFVRPEARGPIARLKEEMSSTWGPLNFAFGLGTVAQGYSQMYGAENSGKYLTPEQTATAQAGMLPGIGAMAGTLIGSMTPIGGWGGGMAGQALGSVAQGVIGATEAKDEAVRTAGERLAAAMGLAASSVAGFKDTITSSGVSVVQFGAALASVGGVGTFGSGTAQGVARLTNAFGQYAGEDFQAIAKYTSSPLLSGMGNRFSSGAAGSDDITALAYDAAEQGDFGGLKTLQQAARDARVKNDPTFQAAAGRLNSDSAGFFGLGALGVGATKWLRDRGYNPNTDISRDLATEDARKAAVSADDPAAVAENTLINQFASLRSSRIVAESGIKESASGTALVEARGGSAAAIAASSRGLFAADAAARTSTQSEISLLQADLANPVNAGRKDELAARIADAQSRLSGYDLTDAQRTRSNVFAQFEENASAFALQNTQSQSGLQRGILSGQSYAFLHGDEDRILSGETARAAEIRREASNPILSPADRDKRLAEATQIESGIALQRHDFQQQEQRQALAVRDLNVGSAALGVEQARSFSTPDAVYQAQGHEADTLRQKIGELTNQLQRGGMTADETAGKIREWTQASGQLNSVLAQQRDERISNSRGMAAADLSIATSPLRNILQIGGSAATDPNLGSSAFASTLASDRTAILQFAPGSLQRRQAEAKLQEDLASQNDLQDSLNVFSPSSRQRIGDIRGAGALREAETAFRLNQMAPWRSGDSPLTAANGLERALKSDIALQGRDQAQEDAFRARQMRALGPDGKSVWDEQAEAGYQASRERRSEVIDRDRLQAGSVERDRSLQLLTLLPEMLAGSPGRGVSSGVIGFDALSARFNPNVLQGSWGHDARPRGASLPGSGVSSAYDGFQSHAAATGHVSSGHVAASPQNALTAAIQNLAHGANGAQIVSVLQQLLTSQRELVTMVRTNQRLPGQNGPPNNGTSTMRQNLSNGLSPRGR